ncbi:phosphoribosylanthranilate isomerase [Pseudochryseolinea flava]|uniref:N-(5'-phosphoribosyl)anthranilate isomerase n=1 Tax=Pseudochryseolinea flava TaxID=2059302 RepID=A0A364XV98_9BACT|nr:phosphoribosylanthranilate isomerase [Pseudochryseolinea flava]RAV98051.1 phosphoribosylanthranilate isomerase [Pseudochryseolinea flava]
MKENLKIKICGMRDHDNIVEVATFQPDLMGFIFYEKSPRFVGSDFIVPPTFPSAIKRVGVFVNASTEEMIQQMQRLELDFLQLHGKESAAQVAALATRGAKVIKAFSVDDNFDFEQVKPYEGLASYFLFDTKGEYYGGNAKVFNWRVLAKYNQHTPFFLSGGLTPENVVEIEPLKDMNLYALDINSGVERSPGVKDLEKIKALYKVKETIS